MSSLLQNILSFLLVYKYVGLFLVAFLSSLGVPLPAGSSTVASAAFASQGYLNIFIVLIVGTTGNILGDLSMYGLSRRYGKQVLRWLHLGRFAESTSLKHIETTENNYSALAIITSRFQDQATAIINMVAGLGRMPFKRFALYAIIGDILQTIFYSSVGYFFAANWQSIYNTIGVCSWIIVFATIIISIFVANNMAKHMMKKNG